MHKTINPIFKSEDYLQHESKEECTWDPSKHDGKPCPFHDHGTVNIVETDKKQENKFSKFKNLTNDEKQFLELFKYENDLRTSIRNNAANSYIKDLDDALKKNNITDEQRKKLENEKKAVDKYFFKGGYDYEGDYNEFFEEIVDNSPEWDNYFNDPKIKEFDELEKRTNLNIYKILNKSKANIAKKKHDRNAIIAVGSIALLSILAASGAMLLH